MTQKYLDSLTYQIIGGAIEVHKEPKGLLLNFNCVNIFREGQKTLVTELFSQLPKM